MFRLLGGYLYDGFVLVVGFVGFCAWVVFIWLS